MSTISKNSCNILKRLPRTVRDSNIIPNGEWELYSFAKGGYCIDIYEIYQSGEAFLPDAETVKKINIPFHIFPDLKKGMAPTQMMAACQLSLQQNIAECISKKT